MKVLLVLSLAALAVAESDPAYLLGYSGYHGLGYSAFPYGYSAGVLGYPYSTYATGAHFIGKREAESDADPYLLYAGYHAPYTAATLGYNRYFSGYAGYPFTTYAGAHFIGKREAEAEADPFFYAAHPYSFGYSAYAPYAAHAYAYHPYAALTPKTVSNDAVSPFNYAAKGNYAAVTAGSAHFAKREAEADPAIVYSAGYTPYAYGAYSAFPYSYGYSAYGAYTPYRYFL